MTEILLVSYDASLLPMPHSSFIVFMRNSRFVEDWYSPFDGCLGLATSETVEKVTSAIHEFCGDKFPFVVTDVGQEVAGAVPDEFWEWFRKPRSGFEVKPSDWAAEKMEDS
jgi:hypothetical protein